jgi:hypothetical protein
MLRQISGAVTHENLKLTVHCLEPVSHFRHDFLQEERRPVRLTGRPRLSHAPEGLVKDLGNLMHVAVTMTWLPTPDHAGPAGSGGQR